MPLQAPARGIDSSVPLTASGVHDGKDSPPDLQPVPLPSLAEAEPYGFEEAQRGKSMYGRQVGGAGDRENKIKFN